MSRRALGILLLSGACLLGAGVLLAPAKQVGTEGSGAASARDVASVAADPEPRHDDDPCPKVERELAERAAQCRSCYERLMVEHQKLQGSVVVAVRLASDGFVTSAKLVADEIADSRFEECVVSNFQGRLAAVPNSNCSEIRVPIRFVPTETNLPSARPGASASK
jgi:hypothetical protein